MSDDKPKLHIDDDWKKQAQAEKQRLAEQEKRKQQVQDAETSRTDTTDKADNAGTQQANQRHQQHLPPATFDALVSTFATQAMIAMGLIEHPEAQKMINLELAKFNIDMLGIIEEKTKGNLSEDEKKLLAQTLHQLRMAFVQVSTANAGPIGA